MTGSIWVRGEGGGIWKMDLPLHEGIAGRLAKGYLTRVNPDGSPWIDDADRGPDSTPAPEAPPQQSVPKSQWVGWAVRALRMAPDDAEAMTKGDLIDLAGKM